MTGFQSVLQIFYFLKQNQMIEEKVNPVGAPGGIRTPDPIVRTDALYPLSYRSTCSHILQSTQHKSKFIFSLQE